MKRDYIVAFIYWRLNMAKYANVDFNQDILNRPNIDKLLNKVKSLKGIRLKDKIDLRYLNKIDKLKIKG